MRLKRPARYNIGIDLDSRVIEAWADPIGKSAFSRSTIGEIPDSAGGNRRTCR